MLPLKGLKHIDNQGETIVLQRALTGERIEWLEVRFGSDFDSQPAELAARNLSSGLMMPVS
jgi:hypothetical protein